jgi:putative ATPase
VLNGATTENPYFEVNSALLSRSKVYVLKALGVDDVVRILRRALQDRERGLGGLEVTADDEALAGIGRYANGDARVALNMLETAAAAAASSHRIDVPLVAELAQNRALL